MVNRILFLGLIAVVSAETAFGDVPGAAPSPQPTLFEASSPNTQVLGKAAGGSFQTGVVTPPSGNPVVNAQVILKIVGAAFQALQALSSPPNTIDGVTYTEVYSFGKRVFSQAAYFNHNGNLSFAAGLAPTEVRAPLLTYPVGPLAIEVDGGVRFQADVQGSWIPNIGVPAELSSLGAQLSALADGAGYIEGYASLLAIRAGVGGQLDLVRAQADMNARISADGSPPYVAVDAMVDFLSGRLYAFLDYLNIFDFGFKRLLDYDLYKWKGYCFDTGAMLCR